MEFRRKLKKSDILCIEPAEIGDLARFSACFQRIWPDEPAETGRFQRIFQLKSHVTLLAKVEETVVGFVSAFEIGIRWQIDLLGVDPAYRGLGIGRDLVGCAVEAGLQRPWTEAHALIRAGNTASERAFQAYGFVPDPTPVELLIQEGPFEPANIDQRPALPVETLTYRGIWLDPDSILPQSELLGTVDLLSTLISIQEPESISRFQNEGFRSAGQFTVWRRPRPR